jgi:hypothetical protein
MPDQAAHRHEDARRQDPTLWPWRAGPWLLPAYWLTIVVLAGLLIWFG